MRLDLSVFALALLNALGSSSIVSAAPVVHLECTSNESCQLSLTENDQTQVYTLSKDASSLFADQAKVVFEDGQASLDIAQVLPQGATKFRTPLGEDHWAVAWITFSGEEGSGAKLDKAIISSLAHGLLEYRNDQLVTYNERRRLDGRQNADDESDVVLKLPEGTPWLDGMEQQRSSPETFIGDVGKIVKFAPGCYPDDVFVHSFQMNVILDYGVYLDLTQSMSGTESAKAAKAVDELDFQFSIAKLVYEAQLNIRLQLKEVMIGKPSDPTPISGSRAQGTCLNAIQSHGKLVTWNSANYKRFQAGYTILLSNCFTGVNGVSYVGGVCQTTSNVGVASFDWLVLAHELGHGFGMNHAFQEGVGRTGSIMDYGNPRYNGAAQFHPIYNKLEVCRFITALKNKAQKCQFFSSTGQSTGGSGSGGCGNGVLAPEEECECLVSGQTSCGKCSMCKLTDSSVQCSSADFMLRTPSMKGTLAVSKSSLASTECCANNKLARPKTACGTENKNTCSADGKCAAVCTKALGSTVSPCGFDSSGCLMGCTWQGKCRYDMIFGSDQALVSAVPDGTACFMNNGSQGRCVSAKCTSSSGDVDVPAASPTAPPTAATPNKPTTPPVINCSVYKKKAQCAKVKACRWCKNKCTRTCSG